jgi:hypothetical protein
MSDNPNWQLARLDDIERRDIDIPVREHFGIHAFGINAYTPGEDGTLISEHDESGSVRRSCTSCTTPRATRRSRATPATNRSATSGGLSSCIRPSASRRAGTTISLLHATTRGSNRLFVSGPQARFRHS